ncbi:MAG: hypothetical protein IPM23_01790 [Candidatus Melainabacteria bacterium]|nr:hypothetical protein [Candidatus Melainabacteria bacterium]
MKSRKPTGLQAIRLKAIKFQLDAMTSQAGVIEKLFTEHRGGIDFGAEPDVRNVLFKARELSGKVTSIVALSGNANVEGVRGRLAEIQSLAAYLVEHAGSFGTWAREQAQERLESDSRGASKTEGQEVESDVLAAYSCFGAETSQYATFELQVKAFAGLALEVAYFAAHAVGIRTCLAG